LSEKLQTKT